MEIQTAIANGLAIANPNPTIMELFFETLFLEAFSIFSFFILIAVIPIQIRIALPNKKRINFTGRYNRKLCIPKKVSIKIEKLARNSPTDNNAPDQNPLVKVLLNTSKNIGPGIAANEKPNNKLSMYAI